MSMLFFSESSQAICKPILVLKAMCAFETSLPERGQTDFSLDALLLEESRRSLQVPSLTAPALGQTCPALVSSSFQILPIMVTAPARPLGGMVGHTVLRLAEQQQGRGRAPWQTAA